MWGVGGLAYSFHWHVAFSWVKKESAKCKYKWSNFDTVMFWVLFDPQVAFWRCYGKCEVWGRGGYGDLMG